MLTFQSAEDNSCYNFNVLYLREIRLERANEILTIQSAEDELTIPVKILISCEIRLERAKIEVSVRSKSLFFFSIKHFGFFFRTFTK